MKNSMKTALIAFSLGLAIAGTATANTGAYSIDRAVQSAISTGNINVSVKDRVATLYGWVETRYDANKARRQALSFNHVDSVIDLISISD